MEVWEKGGGGEVMRVAGLVGRGEEWGRVKAGQGGAALTERSLRVGGVGGVMGVALKGDREIRWVGMMVGMAHPGEMIGDRWERAVVPRVVKGRFAVVREGRGGCVWILVGEKKGRVWLEGWKVGMGEWGWVVEGHVMRLRVERGGVGERWKTEVGLWMGEVALLGKRMEEEGCGWRLSRGVVV